MIHPNIPTVATATHAALTGHEVAPHPPRVEYLATLSKHSAAVNAVRFSPNGQMLASASDGMFQPDLNRPNAQMVMLFSGFHPIAPSRPLVRHKKRSPIRSIGVRRRCSSQ